ncbi:MAG TPA: GGDEF domain-containing protein [Aquabacterium sp.]|uniref:GGDEF domain-containing protein n=1 Tax=Aquabacterium sp. TaxID=1872578 RepID=UPI002E3609B2|nr:GGDEF domain-containing protein [Aquabacterium sp.]HEX5373843.1 GGDEF domain-containing protein [Aquabacterium sp.]
MKFGNILPQWSLSPTARISLGLVSLLIGLLMVLDLVLKLLPDQRSMTQTLREEVAVHLALQVKRMLREPGMVAMLQPMMSDLVENSKDVESVGIRKVDGTLVVSTSRHVELWKNPSLGLSTITNVVVPLNTTSGKWGQLEVGFKSPWPTTLLGWTKQPTVQLVVILSTATFLSFYLYLRRVLQHLDPSKAIPERVRVAFDTLTEGLLVLDIDGQILLANSAFRNFHPQASSVLLGRSIDQVEWLVKGLREDGDVEPPWKRVMKMSEPILGVHIDLTEPGGDHRRALLNCAAIRDATGNPRGALVTLDDITALDQANAKLRAALGQLEVSRDQIQKQNDELQMLANCDPMTGCFNRRAFFARAEAMMAHAEASGEPLSCVMSDIDKFKNFNDTYGHAVGDLVIQQVSKLLKRAMRPQDVLCRYGGEEFCILLPGYDLDKAAGVAEAIRAAIELEAGPAVDAVPNLRITSSFGVGQLGVGDAKNLHLLIERADQGLYAAKEAGRNQVQCIDWAEMDSVTA